MRPDPDSLPASTVTPLLQVWNHHPLSRSSSPLLNHALILSWKLCTIVLRSKLCHLAPLVVGSVAAASGETAAVLEGVSWGATAAGTCGPPHHAGANGVDGVNLIMDRVMMVE